MQSPGAPPTQVGYALIATSMNQSIGSLPRLALPLTALALLASACRISEPVPSVSRSSEAVPPAMVLDGTAYETAARVSLPPESPEEFEGLHNVYRLSDNIISGSEPHGEAALRTLADMGVKTILSVDGKVPDAEGAAALGMRYVHIPIQYKGLTNEEMDELAKSFRELEGPFFVHCFHGKHRGPAAAAVGRIVLDGADRQTAIAEMRQYCGTSSKYEGLYKDIATAYIPPKSETAALDFDFPARKLPRGVVGAMIELSRANDNLDLLADNAFQADPSHPDVDPRNEAVKLLQAFEASLALDEVVEGPADYRGWFEEAHDQSAALVDALARDDADAARESWAAVKQTCTDCHLIYRN